MKKFCFFSLLLVALLVFSCCKSATHRDVKKSPLSILVLTERGGQHESFASAALVWLDELAKVHHFSYTEINDTKQISDDFLEMYQLIIQLDYPPYTWSAESEKAFIKYIEEGRGGWIGFHHATLLGEFDGYPMWQWFSEFMGGIRFKNYIAELATATVHVEDRSHPIMKGVSRSFQMPDDEWYTFDKSPRGQVDVLASVDESSYIPGSDIKMGDHPAIWTNPQVKARNVYFLMGHAGTLFDSLDFTKMFENAILWTSNKPQ